MAMKRKGSRPIVVDGTTYLWRIRRRPTVFQTDYGTALTCSVQRNDERAGRVLLIVFPQGRAECYLPSVPRAPVVPRQVAECIRNAIREGWNPGDRGDAFFYQVPCPVSRPKFQRQKVNYHEPSGVGPSSGASFCPSS